MLLQSDIAVRGLRSATRDRLLQRLKLAAASVQANQRSDGSFARPFGLREASSSSDSGSQSRLESVTFTGHSLEWLALTPGEIAINETVIARACEFAASAILSVSDDELARNYCPYSHAANALRLWCPDAWRIVESSQQANAEQ